MLVFFIQIKLSVYFIILTLCYFTSVTLLRCSFDVIKCYQLCRLINFVDLIGIELYFYVVFHVLKIIRAMFVVILSDLFSNFNGIIFLSFFQVNLLNWCYQLDVKVM